MKKLFRGRVRLILLLAVLLAAATALTAALSGTAWGSRTVQAVLTPFRSGFSALTRQAERDYNYLFNYESLSAENDYLRRQISSMENEVRTADSLQRENERLKELLGLQEEHEDYRFNEDSSSWKSTFTIGKGTRSGLETGMVVVTEYGQVVGLITDIGPNWATVTTVLDTSLEISASVASAGYTGVVQGAYTTNASGKLRMNYLPSDAVLRNNDQVRLDRLSQGPDPRLCRGRGLRRDRRGKIRHAAPRRRSRGPRTGLRHHGLCQRIRR